MNFLVGLTGGIGSGKSTVADLFASLGIRIIDTDQISHQLTTPSGLAMALIRQQFGDEYILPDGSLNRSLMRHTVFSDSVAKQQLEFILHPLILDQTRTLAETPALSPYIIIVIPLLFESGQYADWLNRTIAIDCPEEVQVSRTMQRSHLDKASVVAIMAQQLDRKSRVRQADEVIYNDGSKSKLMEQVVGLHHRLSALAAQRN